LIYINNNAIINNNYGRPQDLILLFKIPTGKRKDFFEMYRKCGHGPSWSFASHAVSSLGRVYSFARPHWEKKGQETFATPNTSATFIYDRRYQHHHHHHHYHPHPHHYHHAFKGLVFAVRSGLNIAHHMSTMDALGSLCWMVFHNSLREAFALLRCYTTLICS